jgi:EAL domain-containing protein (putative c-di-GMP-specific phosphodiesterase class I)
VTNFGSWLKAMQRRRSGIPRVRSPRGLPGVLARGDLSVVYQPIVSLTTMESFAYEALVRSDSPHWTNPPQLFDEAIKSGYVGALGRSIRELATTHCTEKPLFLNVHPNEFDESWLVQPDDPIFTHGQPIYLEVTESVPLTHFAYSWLQILPMTAARRSWFATWFGSATSSGRSWLLRASSRKPK